MKQLVKLKKKGRKAKGKEYYVLSKDTGKLAYAYRPVPDHMAKKRIAIPVCKNCGEEAPADLKDKCSCGCANWEMKYSEEWAYGLVCPECGELLLPAGEDCRTRVKYGFCFQRILLYETLTIIHAVAAGPLCGLRHANRETTGSCFMIQGRKG